jgi:16S rRNA (guanine1207-N2)-methyltransferase
MYAVYGVIPPGLVEVPVEVTQFSPLIPGSAALERMADASLNGVAMLAPPGVIERRYAVAHALRVLIPGAPFTFFAPNKRGGARLHDELTAFGCASDEASRHHHRLCTGVRPSTLRNLDEAITQGAPRFVEPLGLWSQPGIFGWDRIDPGSALLMKHLPPLSGRGADLGCGVGLLARAALSHATVQHMTLIDIDRRAVEAAQRNIDPARSTVLWADATISKAMPRELDFVVMNPPFHDGGTEDQNLGRAFIAKAASLLRKGGVCLLTANRHLPYEAAMKPLFATMTQVVQANGFKIYAAEK